MNKILKWLKRIFTAISGLIIIMMIGLYITFYFGKKDVVKNLPQDSQIIRTDKGKVEYSSSGNGDRYMLMIHGSPGSVHVSGGQSFLDHGFSVLGVSIPGYYQTPLPSGRTPKEEAALYKSLLDTLKIDAVYVNGISGGGPASIQFAIDYPDRCAGLILRAAVSEKIEESADDHGLLSSFFQTEFRTWLGIQIGKTQLTKSEKEKLDWFVERGFFPFESILEGNENDTYQFKNLKEFNLEKITSPTILFHGDKDKNVPFSFSKKTSNRIPNAILVEMKGKDHYDFFLSYGDTVNTEIVRFVETMENKYDPVLEIKTL
ncbi:MAG: 2-hydroxy-6-oxonona-2,4-dienedioate hydrolase [Arcticibacterium sp.]|jgi:2-hydroxy-6-oxonona-2,4-dienedioate hydrolase